MYAEERQHAIAERVRRDGKVTVTELASDYGKTPETIRRDLKSLERHGVLRRVHGGAIFTERFRTEPAVSERTTQMVDEKKRIAEAAVRFIPKTGSIFIDAGTTTQALADLIPGNRDLTIATNSVPIALTLTARPRLHLWLVGGRLRETTLANVDDWALRTLDELRVDVAFVATNGITVDRGLTTPDFAEAAVKRAIVGCGRQVVLLADHTKVGEEHMVKFASATQIDVMVTDDQIDPDDFDSFETIGVEVVKA